ncbi:hypothetical protein IU431_00130 [Nocardia otitidiscaviarum]|uniref:hypothetical protein n=1 Tax=Nocardia otitidiscaviarum TaxID=1823 RepID=UPI0018942CBC|nr:hypothetical protein [Nocardia otitidiscaviarum]MBF6482575.1 hypothetical protein [Nocardia otitidiscaviarum]
MISQVEQWNPDALGTDATNLATVVTAGRSLLQSMLTEQDDLAESWTGPGASAAATRVAKENTAGTHLVDQIERLQQLQSTHKTLLATAKDNVLQTRTNIQNMGFDVYDDGHVNAETFRNALISTARDNGHSDGVPGYVAAAILQMDYAASDQVPVMKGALQAADNAALAAKTGLELAANELARLTLTEAPTKAIRLLFPGLLNPATADPSELPPQFSPLGTMAALQNGVPVTTTLADGSTQTITPNPDGTLTVSTTSTQPDGSTVTTSTTNGSVTTTVATPRTDGSGIIDATITGPDGRTQKLQTIPQGDNRNATFKVNDDGSLGPKLSETYRDDDGWLITDVYADDGALERQSQSPEGFTSYEQFALGPNGEQQLVSTSNSAGMRSEIGEDGKITTTYPDGRTAETTQLENGRVVTSFEDGSMLGYDPDRAAEGVPKQSAWDIVKAWSGDHVTSFGSDTWGTVKTHPWETGLGAGAAAGSEAAARTAGTMAAQAAGLAGESYAKQVIAEVAIADGTPGANRTVIQALDAADDYASKANSTNAVKFGGKLLGWPATAGLNAWANVEDFRNEEKSGWEAFGNAAGGTIGGMAGAAAGAKGAAIGCALLTANPIVVGACALGGAALGGFGGGSIGAYIGQQPFSK